MRRGLIAVATAAMFGVSGCGSLPVGFGPDPGAVVPEIQHYRDAVQAQHRAGMAVLDRLAVAERGLLVLERGENNPGFDPGTAVALLGLGDPPRTAALRHAVQALQAYNDLLVGMGSGIGEPTLRAGLGAFLGGAEFLPEQASNGFGQLQFLARRILPTRFGDTGLRADLIAGGPDAVELIQALRAATPAIWQVMHVAAIEPGNLTDPDGIPPAARAQLQADRRLLAGWVLLLDQSAVAMQMAVAVTRSADAGNIAAMLGAAARMRGLAQAIALTGNK